MEGSGHSEPGLSSGRRGADMHDTFSVTVSQTTVPERGKRNRKLSICHRSRLEARRETGHWWREVDIGEDMSVLVRTLYD